MDRWCTAALRSRIKPMKSVARMVRRHRELILNWFRAKGAISNGVVDNQISRLKYGLRGIIPDGSLIRVSTIGLNKEASFKLQDQFIRELLTALPSQEREFFLDRS